AVLEDVDLAAAMAAGDHVELRHDLGERQFLAVEGNRHTVLEGDRHPGWARFHLSRRLPPEPGVFRDGLIETDRTGGQASAPHRLVVATLHHFGDRDAKLLRQFFLLAPRQVEVADWDE